MTKYPIFLDLVGRRVLLVGAGAVAQRKALTLMETGARLVIVSEHFDPAFEAACATSKIELIKGRYAKEYIGDATLVIAATDDHKANNQVYRDCQEMGILCNSVDEPQCCDFFSAATVTRGRLQVAIGTGGACPSYAGHLRQKLEDIITEGHGRFLDELEVARKKALESIDDEKQRKVVMGKLVEDASFELFLRQGPAAWHKHADDVVASLQSSVGSCGNQARG
jgi:siroheme synthase-like protein